MIVKYLSNMGLMMGEFEYNDDLNLLPYLPRKGENVCLLEGDGWCTHQVLEIVHTPAENEVIIQLDVKS